MLTLENKFIDSFLGDVVNPEGVVLNESGRSSELSCQWAIWALRTVSVSGIYGILTQVEEKVGEMSIEEKVLFIEGVKSTLYFYS